MPGATPDPHKQDGRGWLKQTLADLTRRGAEKDVIAAYVGENARDVVIGKNIIKIGTLVVPTVPVLAVLGIIVAALVFWAVNFLGPTEMTARFNVAVAEVGEMAPGGSIVPSETGTLVSKWIFDELQASNAMYASGSRVEIWHDSMSLLEKRKRLGVIAGESATDRAEAAAALAAEVQADVVLYGHLRPGNAGQEFVLEFYVSPRVRGEADMTIGRYQLGEPIPVPTNFDRADALSKEALGNRIASRSGALFWLLLGLREDLLGQNQQALDLLRQGETLLTGWRERGEGKEILHFFIARQALFLGRYDEAESACNQAIESNPAYPRTQIVLGGVYLSRAQMTEPEQRFEAPSSLELAILAYRRGLALAEAAGDPLMATITRLAVATAYRLKAETQLVTHDYAAAAETFQVTIGELTETLEPLEDADQYRLLAQAHASIGAARLQQAQTSELQGNRTASQAQFEQARAAYAACADQGDHAPEDELLRAQIIPNDCLRWDEVVKNILLNYDGGQG